MIRLRFRNNVVCKGMKMEFKITEHITKRCAKYLTAPEELAEARIQRKMTLNKMSAAFNIPRTTLTSILKEMGLGDIKSEWGKQCTIDKDWLYNEYVIGGRSIDDIAEELGVGRNVVWRVNTEYGFGKLRKQVAQTETPADKIDADPNWIREQLGSGHDYSEIAEQLGVSQRKLKNACAFWGITKREEKTRAKENRFEKMRSEIEKNRRGIESGKVFLQALSELHGVSESKIRKICKDMSINIPHNNKDILDLHNVDEQWVVDQFAHGNCLNDLIKKIGCARKPFVKACERRGIEIPQTKPSIDTTEETIEWVRQEHLLAGRSCRSIAEEFHVKESTVESFCNRFHIQTTLQYLCYTANISESELFDMMDADGVTPESLAEQFNVECELVLDVFLNYDRDGKISKYDFRKWGITPEWIESERMQKNRSVKELAREQGIAYHTMKKICDTNELYSRSFSLASKYGLSDEWFIQRRKDGASIRQLARELQSVMSRPTIRKIYRDIDGADDWKKKQPFSANRLKIFEEYSDIRKAPQPDISVAHLSRAEKYGVTYEWMYRQYIVLRRSVDDIASEFGVSSHAIRDLMFELRIPRRTLSICEKYGIDPVWLHNERCNKKATLRELSRHLNITSGAVKDACIQEHIDEFDVEKFYTDFDTSYDEMYELRYTKGMSFQDIASRLGCSLTKAKHCCWTLAIPDPTSKATYEKNGISYAQLLSEISKPDANLSKIAKALGVSMRVAERAIIECEFQVPHNATHSMMEDKWELFLQHENIPYLLHQKCLIGDSGNTQEIDILCIEHNVGIEISPTYTHNHDVETHWGNETKSVRYHQAKAEWAERIGINLIQVFDWYEERKIKDLVSRLCNKNTLLKACDIEVRKIADKKFVKSFICENSLETIREYDIAYGMFHNQKCIGIMSMHQDKNDDQQTWNISNLCLSAGISSKDGIIAMIDNFYLDVAPNELYIDVNYDLYNGVFFEQIGFSYICTTEPNCTWVKMDGHTFQEIADENINEKVCVGEMIKQGYVRVYGSGIKKFRLSF